MSDTKPTRTPVKKLPVDVPALGISYQFDIGSGRQIVMQTHVNATTDDADANELLDRMTRWSYRQQCVVELDDCTHKLGAAYAALKTQRIEHARKMADFQVRHVQAGRRGQFQPKAEQTVALSNIDQGIANIQGNIIAIRWKIANLTAIINGTERPPPIQDEVSVTEMLREAAE